MSKEYLPLQICTEYLPLKIVTVWKKMSSYDSLWLTINGQKKVWFVDRLNYWQRVS